MGWIRQIIPLRSNFFSWQQVVRIFSARIYIHPNILMSIRSKKRWKNWILLSFLSCSFIHVLIISDWKCFQVMWVTCFIDEESGNWEAKFTSLRLNSTLWSFILTFHYLQYLLLINIVSPIETQISSSIFLWYARSYFKCCKKICHKSCLINNFIPQNIVLDYLFTIVEK